MNADSSVMVYLWYIYIYSYQSMMYLKVKKYGYISNEYVAYNYMDHWVIIPGAARYIKIFYLDAIGATDGGIYYAMDKTKHNGNNNDGKSVFDDGFTE